MASLEKDRILQFRGHDIVDAEGSKIGTIQEIYLDPETHEPRWALAYVGMLGQDSRFVPLTDVTDVDGSLGVPFDKARVMEAPHAEPDGQLSQHEAGELRRHYGLAKGFDAGDAAG